jgi:hypothetical protein
MTTEEMYATTFITEQLELMDKFREENLQTGSHVPNRNHKTCLIDTACTVSGAQRHFRKIRISAKKGKG